MIRGRRPDRIADRTGAHAVDDDDLVEPGQPGVIEVARQRVERLVDPGTTEVQRGGDRAGPLEADRGGVGRRLGHTTRPPSVPTVAANRGDEIFDVDRDPDATGLEGRPAATALEGGDPALPAAAPAAGSLAQPPRPLDRRLGRGSIVLGCRQEAEPGLGTRDGVVEERSRDGLAFERLAGRRDLAAQVLDDPLRLGAGRTHSLVALAPCSTPFLLCVVERLRGTQLGRSRAVERLAGSALCRADRGEGRLERPLRFGQPRAGVVDDDIRQAEALSDGERLAATRQADRQPVGRAERVEVELDRCVAGSGRGMRIRLELRVVGRRRDQGAGPDEMVEQGLRERRALGRVRPGTELVEQHERAGAGLGDDPDDRAEMAGEGRQGLRDRLLVADVGEHVAPDREPAPSLGRDVEAGLVHQAEQPERAQGDGLAAGVGAGHDERRVAVTEPDIDRDDTARQAGMPGRQQHDLGPFRRLGPGAVDVGGEGCLGGPEVEPGEGLERLPEGVGVGRYQRRQLVEDPRDLLGLGDLGLAPRVAELDRHERLDEQRLPAPRRVVDDALDPGPGLRLDGDDVPAVPQCDDRLLERRPELGPDQRVEPAPQAVVRHADGRPEPAEPRRRRVQQLADRVEAARQRRPDGRQGVELAPELAQQRAPVVGQRRRQPGGRIEGVGDLEELGRVQAAAAGRALDGRPDVAGGADADARPLLDERPGLVGLVEHPAHHDRVARRLEGRGQPSRGAERGGLRQPVADRRELEQRLRSCVHRPVRQRPAAGPETDGWPRSTRRHGRFAHGSPAYAIPIRAVVITSGRGSSGGAVSRRNGEPGSQRSMPVQPVSSPNAAATSPGPLARRVDDSRSIRSASAVAWAVVRRRRDVDRRMRSRRIAPTPSSGSTARTSNAAGSPSGSVTTLRQSYIP